MYSLQNIKSSDVLNFLNSRIINKKFYTFLLVVLLSGCACPDVVETRRLGDENMSCQELQLEMGHAERTRGQISSEKGVTGKNVAAVLFFWPALIATHSNVNDAVSALDQRKNHLLDIYNKKGCQITS